MKNTRSHFAAIATLVAGLSLGFNSASAEEFLVGSEVPLTGTLARVGTDMKEGIEIGRAHV